MRFRFEDGTQPAKADRSEYCEHRHRDQQLDQGKTALDAVGAAAT
jgi:hypothetical protein